MEEHESLTIHLRKLGAMFWNPGDTESLAQLPTQPASNVSRITSLSDCVTAVALTLIVVNIQLPPRGLSEVEIQSFVLGSLLPQLGIYLFSYVIVATSWISHAQLFYYVRQSSGLLVMLNVLFLATIVFLPVPITLFFVYGNQAEAWILFAATQVVTGSLLFLIWVYSRSARFLDTSVPPPFFLATTFRLLFIPMSFLISIPLALVRVRLAEVGFVLLYGVARGLLIALRYSRDSETVQPGAVRQNNVRLNSITDNMTAVAITFLIVNVAAEVAAHSGDSLAQTIRDILGELWIYALSFLIIGFYWLSHHKMFQYIQSHNLRLLWLNFAFLFLIELEPLLSDLRAEYLHSPTIGVLYAIGQTLLGLSLIAIWWYAAYGGRFLEPGSAGAFRSLLLHAVLPPIIFVSSIGLLAFNADFAVYLWVLVILVEIALTVGRTKSARVESHPRDVS
jgi:uncharacterized membrane protein